MGNAGAGKTTILLHLCFEMVQKEYVILKIQCCNTPLGRSQYLWETVFILDTFKFLSADVNHKNATKDAMHLIKEVCKLGATFISLGHTNKDGEKFSGTAEIEQDSDGVLRIDGIDEADNKNYIYNKKAVDVDLM